MSLLATNERPLSCTCLPKLLADDSNLASGAQHSIAIDDCDEFIADETVLSTSCPLPRSNLAHANDPQTYSANLIDRLNDYYAYRVERKKSLTPRIYIEDTSVGEPDLGGWSKSKDSHGLKYASNSVKAKSYDTTQATCCIDTINAKQFPINVANQNDEAAFPLSMPPIVVTSSSSQASLADDTPNKYSLFTASTNSIASDTVNNTHMPHLNYVVTTHNSDTTQATQTSTRRQRHSIAGQMGFFKIMDIAGGFSRKMATSTNSLFSTAVISGSSSAPNLHQINTASPSGTACVERLFFWLFTLFAIVFLAAHTNARVCVIVCLSGLGLKEIILVFVSFSLFREK